LIQILLGKGSNKRSRHEAICLALAAHGQSYRAFLAFLLGFLKSISVDAFEAQMISKTVK